MEDRTNETATTQKLNLPEADERRFTQADLEKLIGERLKRERVRHAPLMRMKELLDALKEKGVLNADSCAGAVEELCEKLASSHAENTREEAKDGGEEEGFGSPAAQGAVPAVETDLENAAFASLRDAGNENGEQEPPEKREEETAPEKERLCELRELEERHPEADAASLLADPAFISYAAARNGTLTALYEGYRDSLSRLAAFERERAAAKALSSTGFSAHGAGVGADYGEGLSPAQRDIARRAGMSYREYASLLSQIPQKTRRKGAD